MTNKTQLNTGKIIQITGPVVDVQFTKETLPKIREELYVVCKGEKRAMEVVQHVGGFVVRCVMLGASEGLCRDMDAYATGAPISVPVGEAVLGRLLNVLGEPLAAILNRYNNDFKAREKGMATAFEAVVGFVALHAPARLQKFLHRMALDQAIDGVVLRIGRRKL